MRTYTGRPSAYANDATAGGVAWANTTNAGDTSGNGATVTLAAGLSSQWLILTGFNMQLPEDAIIRGNRPSFEHMGTVAVMVQLQSVVLVKDGGRLAVNGISSPANSTTSFAAQQVGGTTTLLAASVSPSDVVQENYGVAFKVANIGAQSADFRLRNVRLLIAYSVKEALRQKVKSPVRGLIR